jgi:hypothetical protein
LPHVLLDQHSSRTAHFSNGTHLKKHASLKQFVASANASPRINPNLARDYARIFTKANNLNASFALQNSPTYNFRLLKLATRESKVQLFLSLKKKLESLAKNCQAVRPHATQNLSFRRGK